MGLPNQSRYYRNNRNGLNDTEQAKNPTYYQDLSGLEGQEDDYTDHDSHHDPHDHPQDYLHYAASDTEDLALLGLVVSRFPCLVSLDLLDS